MSQAARSIAKTEPKFSALSQGSSAFERPTSIAAATPGEIIRALGKLTIGFDVYDDEDLKAKLALMTEALTGEPLWAIKQGVDEFCHGKVKRKRQGLPLASELGPHVADISAWAREKATADKAAQRQTRSDYPPAEGDGIKFGMSPEEQKLCSRFFAEEFFRTGSKSRRRFFADIKPADIRDWLEQHREKRAAA